MVKKSKHFRLPEELLIRMDKFSREKKMSKTEIVEKGIEYILTGKRETGQISRKLIIEILKKTEIRASYRYSIAEEICQILEQQGIKVWR